MFIAKHVQTAHDGWTQTWLWQDIDDSDDALDLALPEYAEVTFQVFGTFGAGGLDIQGTLVPHESSLAPNWQVLRWLRDGELAQFTAPDIGARLQNVLRIRPMARDGAGPLNVLALFSGPRFGD